MKDCLKTIETAMMAKHLESAQEYHTVNPIWPSGEPCRKWNESKCTTSGTGIAMSAAIVVMTIQQTDVKHIMATWHTASSINGYHKLPHLVQPSIFTFKGHMNLI